MLTFMIIGDGMSDLPLPELDGHTPLEAANCPNMTRLSCIGRSGLLDPLGPGTVAESEEAIMTILGYEYIAEQISRGPLEALGAGLTLQNNDLALRCNFACVSEDLKILNERADTSGIDYKAFSESLSDYCSRSWGVEVQFMPTWKFKGVLVLRGDNLSGGVSAPIPQKGQKASRAHAKDESPEARRTAEIVNSIIDQSRQILRGFSSGVSISVKNPANTMVPWGIGRRLTAQSFQSKYGLRGLCVAGATLVRGIGKLSEMDVPSVPGATGGVDTDTEAKAVAALESRKDHDFILIHVGGPDEASHDGDAASKIMIIEKIDSMLGLVLNGVNLDQTIVVLLADHTSSTAWRRHTPHPTPMVIAGGPVQPDGVREYNEQAAAKGSLGRLSGAELLHSVLAQAR